MKNLQERALKNWKKCFNNFLKRKITYYNTEGFPMNPYNTNEFSAMYEQNEEYSLGISLYTTLLLNITYGWKLSQLWLRQEGAKFTQKCMEYGNVSSQKSI